MAIDLKKKRRGAGTGKYWAAAGVIAVAFFASYAYANAARSSSATPAWASGAQAQNATANASQSGAGGAGCACCGGATQQKAVPGATKVEGGVQKITIDLTTGSYEPNEITAKAGVPIQLDFKGPASSCNGYVQSQDLGFSQDVSNGGTIQLPALKAGTYTWACSMNMYTAKIVVK